MGWAMFVVFVPATTNSYTHYGEMCGYAINTVSTLIVSRHPHQLSFWPKISMESTMLLDYYGIVISMQHIITKAILKTKLVEAIDSSFSQQTPILVLSLQTDSIQYFVGSAWWVLVLDFPGSIDRYQDWKSLVNLQDKYGHITSFISDQDLHPLTELQSYLITKYETIPSWLADKRSHVSISVVSTLDGNVHQAPILP